jgi:methylmalonyl-CoA/ethylmalonyl-CoA epimerase
MISFTFKHIGVAVADLEKAIGFYRSVFGYRVLSGPIEDPIQKVIVCFLGPDDSSPATIELVSPCGDTAPIHKFLTNGIGAYHMCYGVENMEIALAHVRSNGSIVINDPVPAVAFGGRRICWFYTPTRQLIELAEG